MGIRQNLALFYLPSLFLSIFGREFTTVGKMNKVNSTWRPRVILIVLATLFLAPVGVAWWLNAGIQWRPAGAVNNGVLVTPPRQLDTTFPLLTPAGVALHADYLKGKWTLVTIGNLNCDIACTKNFYTMRQVRLAQGKNVLRVQRLFIVVSPEHDVPNSVSEYPEMEVVVLSRAAHGSFLAPFKLEISEPSEAGRIYLIDPLGNLMMLYKPDADPVGIIKDLRRLLKISSIG